MYILNVDAQTEPLPKRMKKACPKLLDGHFFTLETNIESENFDGKIIAKCNECKETKKGLISSTGNFLSHYRTKHKDRVPEMEEYLKKQTDTILTTVNRQPGIIESLKPKCTDKLVWKYCGHTERFCIKFQITKKILDSIIDAHLSFNATQNPSFRVLLETVHGHKLNIPSRYKLMIVLDEEYEELKKALKELLGKQEYLCVTADVWSSHAQSFLGMTVHFIDESFNRRSYLLGFKRLKHRQTYDVLAKTIDSVLQDFGILHSQITNIVTDGGSAFTKMFKKYGDQIDAIVIDMNGDEIENIDGEEIENIDGEEIDEDTNQIDTAQNSEQEENSESPQSSMVDEQGNEFYSEIITLDSQADGPAASTDDGIDGIEIDTYFEQTTPVTTPQLHQIKMPQQRRCMSHLLNLLSKQFEKNLTGLAKTAHRNTFNTLHSLWVIVRKSSCAKTICNEVLNVTLKFPTDTRWNSTFDCVRQCNR